MDITRKLVEYSGRPTSEQEQALREQLFKSHWSRLPGHAKKALKDLIKFPTERNAAYVTGYMCALRYCNWISAADHGYWLAAIGSLDRTPWLRQAVIDIAGD